MEGTAERSATGFEPQGDVVSVRGSIPLPSVISQESDILSEDALKVALALLQGFGENIMPGDAMVLSVMKARQLAMKEGVSEEDFDKMAKEFLNFLGGVNPWCSMKDFF